MNAPAQPVADQLVREAMLLCQRVVDKVDGKAPDGRTMRSSETYAACKAFLQRCKEEGFDLVQD